MLFLLLLISVCRHETLALHDEYLPFSANTGIIEQNQYLMEAIGEMQQDLRILREKNSKMADTCGYQSY